MLILAEDSPDKVRKDFNPNILGKYRNLLPPDDGVCACTDQLALEIFNLGRTKWA